MDLPNEVALATIANGAADELFRAAVARVIENLTDPNTDHKKRRRITIAFDFHIDENRRNADVELTCVQTLAGQKGVTTQIVVGRHHGALRAVELPGQAELFTQPQGGPRPLETAAAGGGDTKP